MYAERLMLETDKAGSVKRMPRLPPNTRLEAIFLVVDASGDEKGQRHEAGPSRLATYAGRWQGGRLVREPQGQYEERQEFK